MIKKESIYNNDSDSRTTRFAGRLDNSRGYATYYNGKTIMSSVDVVYPKDATDADLGRMMKLSKYLQPKANYLGYKGNKDINSMDAVKIGEAIGVGESQAKRFIKRMTDTGMMMRGAKRYYINPIYFLNGKYMNDEL
ncbi:hypothetical protein FQ087_21040 [Sporosarcina sp. ANT_H38]|uniref:hypothetical protein n=1 Tax=Sporosarcina sp. ANT_H38 TaxID=2597358 RepID=UPI0011F34B80|nr:hypothetical protein [Sporosarcina sp. ANT_H38]KAA0941641.1 hypothetical protein FQ087_21040 [Sporosarcina sp. ANT_H38]